MPGHTRTRTVGFLLLPLLALIISCTATAQMRFDLPAQPLAQSLTALGSAANLNIYFDATTVDGIQAPPLKAELSPGDALARLLSGTRLHAVRVDENTFRVVTDAAPKDAQSTRPATTGAIAKPPARPPASVRLADASPGAISESDDAADGSASSRSKALDEVLVTAEKRTERLQDVPVPVTSISADTLTATNQVRLQDYYTNIPGLSVTPNTQSQQLLSIRGISTGVSNPTVGITIDGAPFGSSTNNGGGSVVPDIDPSDLARIEVLRGPQGTLYGASSMGGLINFVTLDPSTRGVEGRMQAGLTDVKNGTGVGYSASGSVNMPVADTLAFRASGFFRDDPGYIDNPILHENGLNDARARGGLLSGLWRPVDTFSLKLTALYQQITGGGSSDVDIASNLSGLQQNYVPGAGAYDRKVQSYSVNANARLGIFDLTSVTGYNVNAFSDSIDFGYRYGPLTNLKYGVAGAPLFNQNATDKFTQELRVAASFGPHLDWLLGGFYTHEHSSYEQDLMAENPLTGVIVADTLTVKFPTTYSEYAGFTDLTWHFTDQFDIQIGARESHDKETYHSTEIAPLVGLTTPIINPGVASNANAFTYLVTPRLKLTPDMMVYARFASGYRAGGPNLSPGPGTPSQYDPDKTQNYEIGTKSQFFDHRLSIEASLYYIDWRDIQIILTNPQSGLSYTANGSRAKSDGLELSIQSRPLAGLTVSGWAVWNAAALTQAFPPMVSQAYGASGDRLPYSSRFSGNLSLEEEFPLSANLSGFVGGAVSYLGNREGPFEGLSKGVPMARQYFPAYAKTDLRAGIRLDTWTVNLFVNNVTDRLGVLTGGIGYTPPYAFQYIQPRTVGLSVIETF